MSEQVVLTPEKAQQIGLALARYREIGASPIINPRNEAELTGLRNFFTQCMIEHGNEFMGCWMAVRAEYEPLVQVIERIADRISSIRANRIAQAQQQLAAQVAQPTTGDAAATADEPAPAPAENVIQLERPAKS